MTLKLALVACLGLGAYAQTPPQATPLQTPPTTSQVSKDPMTLPFYMTLLRRMEVREAAVAKAEAAGKDPQHRGRKWLQELTGLTDQEFAKVRPIMLDAISATNASKADAKAVFDQAMSTNGGGPLTTAQKHAIGALNAHREQLILDHVQQIEAALGSGRFQEFDAAVRKAIGPSMKVIDLKK